MGRDSSLGFDNTQWRTEKRSPTTGALDAAFGTGGTLLEDPTPYSDIVFAALLDGSYLYLAGGQGLPGFDSTWKIEKRNR
jgi:hypothetical protein